jgi:ribonucleoside-diphosphate reductase alpha chain
MDLRFVRKRNGVLQKFQIEKIELAIYKALRATNSGDFEKSRQIAERIVSRLQKEDGDVPSVEQVQDAVEEELISMNLPSAAKAYILYREKRREEREGKRLLGVEDRLKLSINAASVLRRRYLRRDDAGNVIETPE